MLVLDMASSRLPPCKRVFKVQACEPNPSCRAVFSELTGFEADPETFNPSIAARYAGRFEVFLMSQVLEHIATLDETLKLIHEILKEGGIAVIAVPHFKSFISILQGKKDMFIIPPVHLNFFSKAGLISLFSRHNFTVLRLETISRFPPDSIHKIISVKSIAKPGVPS